MVTALFTTVKYWAVKFARGRPSCQNELAKHHSGRPNEVTMPEIGNKIHEMVLDDSRLKMRDLTDLVRISNSTVYRILTENSDVPQQ